MIGASESGSRVLGPNQVTITVADVGVKAPTGHQGCRESCRTRLLEGAAPGLRPAGGAPSSLDSREGLSYPDRHERV